jgi:uncharacterized membrane protein
VQEFIDAIGYGLCHQLPSRTFFAGGLWFPVCARDTGIYFGIVATFCILLVLYRKRSDAGFFPVPVLVLVGFMFVPLAFDGVTSYLGLRETCNTVRFFTGCGAGSACGILLFWALRTFLPTGDVNKKLLSTPLDLSVLLGADAVLSVGFFYGFPWCGFFGAFFISLCILATITLLNVLIFLSIKRRKSFYSVRRHLVLICVSAACATFLELACLGILKYQIYHLILT